MNNTLPSSYFDSFLFEAFGSSEIGRRMTRHIVDVIGGCLGRLILQGKVTLTHPMRGFKEPVFDGDLVTVFLTGRNYGYVVPNRIVVREGVVSGLVMHIELTLSPPEMIAKRIFPGNEVWVTVDHEFNHVVERYLTASRGKAYDRSWRMGHGLQTMNRKYPSSPVWAVVSNILYLSLPHEMRARVSSMYQYLVGLGPMRKRELEARVRDTKDYAKEDPDYVQLLSDYVTVYLGESSRSVQDCERRIFDHLSAVRKHGEMLMRKMIRTVMLTEYFSENMEWTTAHPEVPPPGFDYSDYIQKK